MAGEHKSKATHPKAPIDTDSASAYRTLFESASVGMLIVHDVVIDCNPAAAALHRTTPEALIGRPLSALGAVMHPKGGAPNDWLSELVRRARAGHPQVFEYRLAGDDEAAVELEVTLQALTLQDQVCLLATERDVTDERRTLRALRDAEELFRGVVTAAQGGVAVYDRDLRYVYWNRTMEEVTGVVAKDAMGKTAKEVFPHLEGYPIEVVHRRALAGENVTSPDVWNPGTQRGKRGWTFGSYTPWRDGEGKIIGVVGTIHDITQRKEAEAADKLKSDALENSLNGIAILDPAGVIRYANRVFLSMRGYQRLEDALGVRAVVHLADPTVEDLIRDDIERSRASVREVTVRRIDGSTFDELLSIRPFADQFGNGLLICTSIDITERKKTEAALRLTQFCVDHASIGILQVDAQGRIVGANQQICAWLGYAQPELCALRVQDIDPQYHGERLRQLFADLEAKRTTTFETVQRAKHGEQLPVEVTATHLDYDGQGVFVCFVRDIRERIQAEEDRRRLEAQLRHAQKMEAVGTLAGGVAHDFNNLLQIIGGYVQLLADNPRLRSEEGESLERIQGAVERAGDLVRRLLTFSRRLEPGLRSLDLNHQIRQAVKIMERTLPKRISLVTDLKEGLRPILGDPNQIEQVLLNLGTNARDAMPEGGRITITTRDRELDEQFCSRNPGSTPGLFLELVFSDTGHGIDAETIEHIFDPFYTTKEIGQGTGLGLATAYGIVKSHHGYISCESEPGRGATFRIYWPVTEGEVEDRAPAEEPREVPGGRETILIVDDEKDVLDIGRAMLKSKGYPVRAALSGEEALEVYGKGDKGIDLVIMDLGMPGMGGQKALQEILSRNPSAKVIIASGYTTDERVQACLKAGAAAFVPKPYRLADMTGTVRKVLDDRA